MARCMICNVEFDPASGSSKSFCPKHCAPIPQNKSIFAKVDVGLRAIMGLAILTLISIFLIALIYSCAQSHGLVEFTYPRSVLDHKTSVIDGNTELDVTIKLRGWDAGAGDVYSATQDMEEIMKHELKEGGAEQNTVFHIVGDAGGGYDNYGNPRPTHLIGAFDIRYSMEDIRQINWDHISEFRLLNLGIVSGITPAGVGVAKEYCEKNREYSQVFCEGF